ncbi:ISP [Glarea lozoyensis ATCC 20868]|uniref:ISP n=1 Tax=Glarea lozoyensis (strain ATCC 20868 / MF5171) TaxID=1116229 RepID=S3DF14_GLAL2|nr:ISP [Glarea lozoyensis ATCC 20868]EPE37007.1 ISP [Glarea lozoyensis ATCC 20868]
MSSNFPTAMTMHDVHSYTIVLALPLLSILMLKCGFLLLGGFKQRGTSSQWSDKAVLNELSACDVVRVEKGLSAVDDILAPVLPQNWWTDDKLFQLERRAVFSKNWLLATHACRFKKPGDYRTFEVAGYSILLILGKDKMLRAFQNICRHRAYRVTKKESGSSAVLGCRYHGWAYDTKGKLIKAPEFDNVSGFDKSKNGLWGVRLRIREGLVYINLACENVDEAQLATSARDMSVNWSNMKLQSAEEWKFDVDFNWKLADFTLSSWKPETGLLNWLPLALSGTKKAASTGMNAETHHLGPGTIMTICYSPKSSRTTTIECCIYTSKPSLDPSDYNKWKDQIMKLSVQTEGLQERLISGNGSLQDESPEINKTAARQHILYELMKAHAKEEEYLQAEVHPASRSESVSSVGKADDSFCRNLANGGERSPICKATAGGVLEW